LRIAVYYDLDRGGAAGALERFVNRLRRDHQVDVYAAARAWPITAELRAVTPPETAREKPGPLYYANRLTQPLRLRSLVRAERALAGRLRGYDRVLVHSCRHRGAPALLSFLAALDRPPVFYVTEPLRLYREPRAPDAVAPPLWLASRLVYAPVAAWLNGSDARHGRATPHRLANSAYTARRVKSVYGGAAEIVHPPIDPFFLQETPGTGDGGFILSPGALIPQKGHGRLIRALARWPERPPLVVAGFAGRAGYVRRLERLARSRGVELRVETDPTRETLRSLMRAARVVAVAAFREPFGLVSVEAQAAGRPVVVADEGGLPETILAGETGLAADPAPEFLAEALRRLWEDPAQAARWGLAGRDHARRRFTPEVCGQQLSEALQRPLRENTAPGTGREPRAAARGSGS
jgi:glycosyltransferase involved in cell wall biosynthesis